MAFNKREVKPNNSWARTNSLEASYFFWMIFLLGKLCVKHSCILPQTVIFSSILFAFGKTQCPSLFWAFWQYGILLVCCLLPLLAKPASHGFHSIILLLDTFTDQVGHWFNIVINETKGPLKSGTGALTSLFYQMNLRTASLRSNLPYTPTHGDRWWQRNSHLGKLHLFFSDFFLRNLNQRIFSIEQSHGAV